MNPDPFQFSEHQSRDPDLDKAVFNALGLRAAATKYELTQHIYNMRLPAKAYRNLIRSKKLCSKEKIQITSDTLQSERFCL